MAASATLRQALQALPALTATPSGPRYTPVGPVLTASPSGPHNPPVGKPSPVVQYTAVQPAPAPGAPGAPGAPAAPGAAGGVQPQQLPFDAGYELTAAAANRRYEDAMAKFLYEEGRTKSDYGFDDPSNPFSKAKMLERAFKQGQRMRTNVGASRGHLYSGSTQNSLNEGVYQNAYSGDQLKRAYLDALAQLGFGRASALSDKEEKMAEAYADWISRAPRPDDPGPPVQGVQPGEEVVKGQPYTPMETIPRDISQATINEAQQVYSGAPKGQPFPGGGPQVIPRPPSGPTARETEVRDALMAHGPNWSQRARLLAELAALRAARGA